MENNIKAQLITLFENWSGEKARAIVALPPSGSYREYYRITGRDQSALGVFNSDEKENHAFVEFTKSFVKAELPVPTVYAYEPAKHIYLIQDLGDITLFAFIQATRKNDIFPEELVEFYKKSITQLIQFQLKGSQYINFSNCYPRQAFDRQSMLWDLHYFKYYFLKLAKIPFDEQLLEDDFNRFIDFLLEADANYFLYRDFQSRNIMVYNNEPWFIDYQGGRRGALQYDLASLLYDAKAEIPEAVRIELLNHYLEVLSQQIIVDRQHFTDHFYGFVLIRLMQAMGAYGFRGFYEKKEHFLQSIPLALNNLSLLLSKIELPIEVPILFNTLQKVAHSQELRNIADSSNTLTVVINSFSYKRGIPIDVSGNGGGFVFDCRALHNPGRYDQYKTLTGKDKAVTEFLEREEEVAVFMQNVNNLVNQSIEKYTARGFKHLMVSFGCTGGQHRSVYCAERLAEQIKSIIKVRVVVRHLEQEMKQSQQI